MAIRQRYASANNNPTTMVDPSGHMAYRSGNLEETIAWAQANFGGVAGAFLTLALVFNCILFGDCVIPEAMREHTVTWSARSLLFAGGGFPVLPTAHGVNASVFDNPFGGGGRGAGRLRTGSLGGIWNAVKGGILGWIALAFELAVTAPPQTASTVIAEPVPTPVQQETPKPVSTAPATDPIAPPVTTATPTTPSCADLNPPGQGKVRVPPLFDGNQVFGYQHISLRHGPSSSDANVGKFYPTYASKSALEHLLAEVLALAPMVNAGTFWKLGASGNCTIILRTVFIGKDAGGTTSDRLFVSVQPYPPYGVNTMYPDTMKVA